jgi:hypothetical protein
MWLPFALVLFVLGPLLAHEILRFNEHHHDCTQQWLENEMLLRNAMCSDARQRNAHGPKMEQTCRQAEQENSVSPGACAVRQLWRQGALYHLWDAFVGSPWMLFGLAGVAIIMAFQGWQYRAQRQMQERLYRETVLMHQQITPPPSPVPAQPQPIQLIMQAPSEWLDRRGRADNDYVYARDVGGRSRVDL